MVGGSGSSARRGAYPGEICLEIWLPTCGTSGPSGQWTSQLSFLVPSFPDKVLCSSSAPYSSSLRSNPC